MPIRLVEIEYDSPAYVEELALRDRVLRAPLGFCIYDDDLSKESAYRHFGLFENGVLLSCLMVVPWGADTAQLKQMAVEEAVQGQGLGRRIVSEVVSSLSHAGVQEVWLNAREPAVGFYEKLGFEACGDYFLELAIPHVKMTKKLG